MGNDRRAEKSAGSPHLSRYLRASTSALGLRPSPSVGALTHLSPDFRLTLQSFCLRVSGVVAPSALDDLQGDSSLSCSVLRYARSDTVNSAIHAFDTC